MAATSTGEHIPLASQVGGHAGVLSSADGSLIIKPCLKAERDFYEVLVRAGPDDVGLTALRALAPAYHGTLIAEGGDGKESIVLENLSKAFTKPNILDIKLGTALYDDDASEEKKQRMIKTAAETTSLETGIRMTGFQVYDYPASQYVNTPKSYGKNITVSQLPEAFAKFFPVAVPTLNLSAESKDDITPSNPAGLPPAHLLPVLRGVLHEVRAIEEAFQKIELRMVGGSALIIYEGDPTVLKTAVKAIDDGTSLAKAEDQAAPPAYKVKMIDFAHTKMVPGQGQDEGVLLGLNNACKYLEGRIKEVEEILGSSAQLV